MKRTISLALACAMPWTAVVAAGDWKAGQTKAEEVCKACHGTAGVSSIPQYPHLAGQHASYIVKVLEDYKTGARQNAIMAGFAAPLTEADRENLGAYYERQQKLVDVEYTK